MRDPERSPIAKVRFLSVLVPELIEGARREESGGIFCIVWKQITPKYIVATAQLLKYEYLPPEVTAQLARTTLQRVRPLIFCCYRARTIPTPFGLPFRYERLSLEALSHGGTSDKVNHP